MPNLDLGDVTIAYEQAGSGEPPFVLVHGYTGSKLDFVDVVPVLAQHRRVVAYDHRGHGESTNTADAASYTFERLVADAERIVDRLELPQFDLLGHSMGGVIAMQYVLAHPDRVRSLVLMDTAPVPMTFIPREFVDHVVGVGRAQGMHAVSAMLAGAMGDTDPVIAERLAWKFERLDVEAFDALGRELGTYPSMVDRLGEIACPVSVIVGENDGPLRPAADVLASAINGATLTVIPDAGHSPQDENRAAWLAAIDAHFERQGWTKPT